ncbi:hypothetical protein A2X44_05045 [candidate division CPR3 bacterium GWF2_35_18]|uniref:Fido domain-containing protein n=1 Tax=candidate division CPR3 bacterium GW2011_GWF2_35_18 TaxID=1618350 RepID=A0A0G0BK49_UNCC3|nr:MAG: hypothetical protein UR67_C0003G0086 [candidate division CPR3 bacterium GW2011_GWF2_35_18]KKP87256.1 MAG: hypothetical protein UR87_C0001G0013 [candidate division CPR3 bacterium GW2011_GWE2_35_7]OGB63697.1 MAG: hypothetical protein A2X44_05045 [candidate division CPR3 bacterium GWF2_35_18]OGB64983.1 MAG: hypothetical protein A2250_01000 [candidate division CPR3 bacterium RIFOXYA2_FULL_35_13]OGB76874.1 MAG: hypothetical protein A2476_04770 [candidate division CPR3 bacterium RIFOXYC2_FULL
MLDFKFRINNNILKNISQIEASKQIIENSPLLPYYERQFQKEAVVRAVHHSTHIEGNMLDIDDAKKIINGQKIESAGKERDLQDIINYRNVLNYIESIQSKSVDLNPVLQVHKIVGYGIIPDVYCGKFRNKQVVIRNTKTQKISYVPPSYLEVEDKVSELLSWLKSQKEADIHPVIKSGLFHCQFVKIHPFVDGNGRTARALTTLILYLDGYDIKKFFCLDEYYDHDLKRYYQALQSVTEFDQDYTFWLEYFTNGLLEEFLKIKQKVLKISRDQRIKKSIGQVYLTERQEKIVEYLQEIGRLQNQDFPKILSNVSEDTFLRDLKELIVKKVIKKRGKTKAAFYELKN